jgi:hypothetical protein
VRVHAKLALSLSEVTINATADFEQTTRLNGTKVTKVAISGASLTIGDAISLSGLVRA